MFKTLCTSLTLGAFLCSATAHADNLTPTRQGFTFLGAAAAGAALGGPVGLIVGALTGAWYAEEIGDAAQLEPLQDELQAARTQWLDSDRRVVALEARAIDDAAVLLEQLQLELMFRTGESQLSDAAIVRLSRLAEYLVAQPHLLVRLDGYADPRGTDAYNQQLSTLRAEQVADVLEDAGVEAERIQLFGHGSRSLSIADSDAYAMERVVRIVLGSDAAGIVAAH